MTRFSMSEEVYRRLEAWALSENCSVDDLIVGILDKATRRWAGLKALEGARRLREEIASEHGMLPDSTPLIRQMREERIERLDRAARDGPDPQD